MNPATQCNAFLFNTKVAATLVGDFYATTICLKRDAFWGVGEDCYL